MKTKAILNLHLFLFVLSFCYRIGFLSQVGIFFFFLSWPSSSSTSLDLVSDTLLPCCGWCWGTSSLLVLYVLPFACSSWGRILICVHSCLLGEKIYFPRLVPSLRCLGKSLWSYQWKNDLVVWDPHIILDTKTSLRWIKLDSLWPLCCVVVADLDYFLYFLCSLFQNDIAVWRWHHSYSMTESSCGFIIVYFLLYEYFCRHQYYTSKHFPSIDRQEYMGQMIMMIM